MELPVGATLPTGSQWWWEQTIRPLCLCPKAVVALKIDPTKEDIWYKLHRHSHQRPQATHSSPHRDVLPSSVLTKVLSGVTWFHPPFP
jgi:hypothetical protein